MSFQKSKNSKLFKLISVEKIIQDSMLVRDKHFYVLN